MAQRRYAVREDQWERIQDVLSGREGHVGGTVKDNRLFVDAVLYRYRAGIAWRDLPERFGDCRVIPMRHTRWSTRGVWRRTCKHLAEGRRQRIRHDRFHHRPRPQHSAGANGGPGNGMHRALKGWMDNKHPCFGRCAGPSNRVPPDTGHAHDRDGANRLLPHLLEPIQAFLADNAYDAQERVPDLRAKAGVTTVIPPPSHRTPQREHDKDLYQARHLIENFFATLTHYHAIATWYDKRAHTFLGAISLAASVI